MMAMGVLKGISTQPTLGWMKYVSSITKLIGICLFSVTAVQGQPNAKHESQRLSAEHYITAYSDAAVTDMARSGVPASITLAQGMFESDYGNSPLAREANNHFGIKCHKEWSGPTYHQDDDAPNECFRKYSDVWQSYADHSEFLRSRERYAGLFELNKTDYKGWAHGLKKAGYATNPHYAHRLIEIIERYDLTRFDQSGLVASRTFSKTDHPAEPVRVDPPKAGDIQADASMEKPRRAVPAVSGRDNSPVRTWKIKKTASPGNSSGAAMASADAGINKINGVPYVVARDGDTWSKIAREYNVELWQVLEFNDAVKNDPVAVGDIVYLRNKKNKAESFTHTIAAGETLRDVAKRYGVKLSRLYKMNELAPGQEPQPGTKVYLQRAMLMGVVL
jgi:LysM repeat protein